MPPYRVFIAAEVLAFLKSCPHQERFLVTRLFEELVNGPYRTGDYLERD